MKDSKIKNQDSTKNNKIQELKKTLWNLADEMRNKVPAWDYAKSIMSILFIKHISEDWEENFSKNEVLNSNKEIEDRAELGHYYIEEKFRWRNIIEETKKDNNTRKLGELLVKGIESTREIHRKSLGEVGETKHLINLDKSQTLVKVVKLIEELSEYRGDNEFSLVSEIYEYFIGEFFRKTAQNAGSYFTPNGVIDIIIQALDIQLSNDGTNIYDPASGVGGMLIKAYSHLLEIHEKEKLRDSLLLYGQEIDQMIWNFGKLNFVSWGFPLFDASGHPVLGETHTSTLENQLHKDIDFNYVLANPPFNVKKFEYELISKKDYWPLKLPKTTANYAWLQHILNSLSDNKKSISRSACILTSTTLGSNSKDEKAYRKLWVDSDQVEAIIQLPERLFVNTSIPSCIWFFNKNKQKNKEEVLFIDLGDKKEFFKDISKTQQEITKEGIKQIANLFKDFRNGKDINIKDFCKVVENKDIVENDYNLSSNRYIEFQEEVIDVKALIQERKELKVSLKEGLKTINEIQGKIDEEEKEFEELIKEIGVGE